MNYKGFVHRDMKLSNIIIKRLNNEDDKLSYNPKKNIKVTVIDFNLSIQFKGQPNLSKHVAGTTGYLAPEVCYKERLPLHGHGFDHKKLDAFSIGVICWE